MMNIKTTAPVYINKKRVSQRKYASADGTDDYYNAGGKFLNKLKGSIQKLKDSGVIDKVKGALGKNTGSGTSNTPPANSPQLPSNDQDGIHGSKPVGMSTGAKIGIAVGVIAIVGIIIYVVNKKKNK